MPVPFGVQCSKRLSADERDGRAGMLDKVDALFARLEERHGVPRPSAKGSSSPSPSCWSGRSASSSSTCRSNPTRTPLLARRASRACSTSCLRRHHGHLLALRGGGRGAALRERLRRAASAAFFIQGAPFAALAAYLMLGGLRRGGASTSWCSARARCSSPSCAGSASSVLYCRHRAAACVLAALYGDTLDGVFNQAVSGLLPIAAVIALFAALNADRGGLLTASSCIEQLFFARRERPLPAGRRATLGSGLLYLLLNNVMWFFGIHGGNMLDGVAQSVFVPGTAANAAALAAGGEHRADRHEDVLRRVRVHRRCRRAAVAARRPSCCSAVAATCGASRRSQPCPWCFNISEIMMFGLPVVWNPALFVPFIVVPLVNMVVAYARHGGGPRAARRSWTCRGRRRRSWAATWLRAPPAGAVLQLVCIAARHGAVPAVLAPLRARWPTITRGCEYRSVARIVPATRRSAPRRSVELAGRAAALAGRGGPLARRGRAGQPVERGGPSSCATSRSSMPPAAAVGAEALLRMRASRVRAGSTRRS